MSTLADLALSEFRRRHAVVLDMVSTRQRTQRQAEAMLTPWAACARYYQANLPASLCAADGSQLLWLDFYPAQMRSDEAMTKMANEVRRAAGALLTRHAADTGNEPTTARARDLLRIDEHLSVMAGLGPIDWAAVAPAAEQAA